MCAVSTLISDKGLMEAQLVQIREQQKEVLEQVFPGLEEMGRSYDGFLKTNGR